MGFGFIIRGRGPVYVHTVDHNGPAAAVGLTVSVQHLGGQLTSLILHSHPLPSPPPLTPTLQVGELLLEVNGLDVRLATHKDVAQIILRGSSCTTLKTLVKTPAVAAEAKGSHSPQP